MLSDADTSALHTRLMAATDYLGDGFPPDDEHVERVVEMAAVLVESSSRSLDLRLSEVAPWCAARLTHMFEMRGVERAIAPAVFEERLLRVGRLVSASGHR